MPWSLPRGGGEILRTCDGEGVGAREPEVLDNRSCGADALTVGELLWEVILAFPYTNSFMLCVLLHHPRRTANKEVTAMTWQRGAFQGGGRF